MLEDFIAQTEKTGAGRIRTHDRIFPLSDADWDNLESRREMLSNFLNSGALHEEGVKNLTISLVEKSGRDLKSVVAKNLDKRYLCKTLEDNIKAFKKLIKEGSKLP